MRKLFVVLVAIVSMASQRAPEKPRASAGTGTLIIGSYPKQFWIIDEATEKIVGTIPFQSGIPRRTTLSRDRKRFYTIEAQMEKVEILDIAARKTLDTFTLSEGTKKVRIRSVEPDPQHRYLIMVTAAATKLVDRFEIGAPTIVQYDLATHRIIRTIPWPNGDERQGVNLIFSPDGKLLYIFNDQDVLIYETTNFTQVDKWEMSRPIEEGFGRLDFGSRDVFNDEPGFYTSLFTVTDSVQHRRTMGIGRVSRICRRCHATPRIRASPSPPTRACSPPSRSWAAPTTRSGGSSPHWAATCSPSAASVLGISHCPPTSRPAATACCSVVDNDCN